MMMMMMIMMMMMTSGFVERVINSPQTRCRSAKQVGLQMSSERHDALYVTKQTVFFNCLPFVFIAATKQQERLISFRIISHNIG